MIFRIIMIVGGICFIIFFAGGLVIYVPGMLVDLVRSRFKGLAFYRRWIIICGSSLAVSVSAFILGSVWASLFESPGNSVSGAASLSPSVTSIAPTPSARNNSGSAIVATPEFMAYRNILAMQLHKAWRWHDRSSNYRATIKLRIETNGEIKDVRVVRSSGNTEFDDSVLNAAAKASPVPPPPDNLYNSFKEVLLVFDPTEPVESQSQAPSH